MDRKETELNFNCSEEEIRNDANNKVITILLFGETGVGKSTFINAAANYLNYSSLRTAMKNDLKIKIPSNFTILDENYEERVVKIGEHANEQTKVDASSTQCCMLHTFPIQQEKLIIQFIDTPGIADTRGVDQDNINFDNILSFLAEMKQLNAICILLKPNDSRLTVQFEYCIKQLLTRLDKSASNNFVFIFTNTRGTFYRPGETLPLLKKLFEGIPSVEPLSKKNIFCLDNEGFRFLVAHKNGIKFDRQTIDDFSDSWMHSSREFVRMIHYIAGGGPEKMIPLQAYMVQNMISINEARRLIGQLAQPLAEIAQLIQNNISLLQRHSISVLKSSDNLIELKKKLLIPFTNSTLTKLNKPVTVCTNPDCCQLYEINNVKTWHYKQRCHDPCCLLNVQKEIVGPPDLLNCAVFSEDQNSCSKCKCSYKKHMHIYYETTLFNDTKENEDVRKQIEDGQNANQIRSNLINKIQFMIREQEAERDTILKTTAKFAHFLQENAITPYNDAYRGYLLYLIDREKSMGDDADRHIIIDFTKMLDQYEEEKKIFSDALKDSVDGTDTITAKNIVDSINSLYSLKHNGNKIKELIFAQNGIPKNEFNIDLNCGHGSQSSDFKSLVKLRNDRSRGYWGKMSSWLPKFIFRKSSDS